MTRKYTISEVAKKIKEKFVYTISPLIFRLLVHVQPSQSGSSIPKVRLIMFTSIPNLYVQEICPVMLWYFYSALLQISTFYIRHHQVGIG